MNKVLLLVLTMLFVSGCGYEKGACVLVTWGNEAVEATYIEYDGAHWFKINDQIYGSEYIFITDCNKSIVQETIN